MFRRLLLIVTIVSLIAPPAHAQLAVIDPANLVQTTLIAYRMQQQLSSVLRAAGSVRPDGDDRAERKLRRAIRVLDAASSRELAVVS